MLGRHTIPAFMLLSLAATISVPALRAQNAPAIRVRDMKSHLQSVVTVQGRAGYIVEHYEKQGSHAFTLRDDYNDQIVVRAPNTVPYPVMGVTYRVTGWPTQENGNLLLNTLPGHIVVAYPSAPPVAPSALPPLSVILLWAGVGIASLALLTALGVMARGAVAKSRQEWGELIVASGPDKGRTVSLRKRKIAIGRGVSALRGIRLSGGDPTISNVHALLVFRHDALSYYDMSRNGTRIGGERLKSDSPTRIHSGDLIHLGTRGTVIIIRLRDTPYIPSFWSRLREDSPMSDQTLMFPEAPQDEPIWARASETSNEYVPMQPPEGEEGGTEVQKEVENGDSAVRPLFSFVSVPPRDRHPVLMDTESASEPEIPAREQEEVA